MTDPHDPGDEDNENAHHDPVCVGCGELLHQAGYYHSVSFPNTDTTGIIEIVHKRSGCIANAEAQVKRIRKHLRAVPLRDCARPRDPLVDWLDPNHTHE